VTFSEQTQVAALTSETGGCRRLAEESRPETLQR